MSKINKVFKILAIIKKEFILDFRQIHLVLALFLYVLTNSYIAYKTFNVLPKVTWGAIFLIIFLYVGLNSVLKSFGHRYGQRQLHYYSYYDPIDLFLAKVIYNFALLFVLGISLALVLLLFSSNIIQDWSLFLISVGMGAIGLSVVFSFVSLLSLKSNSNTTVFSVLALPLVLPILLLMLKINATALGLIIDTSVGKDILLLLAIILLFFALSIILFPTLWKS